MTEFGKDTDYTIPEWMRKPPPPSGSYSYATPTLYRSYSDASAAIDLANKETTDRDVKLVELELSKETMKNSHEKTMKEWNIIENGQKHETVSRGWWSDLPRCSSY